MEGIKRTRRIAFGSAGSLKSSNPPSFHSPLVERNIELMRTVPWAALHEELTKEIAF
jgi:hypothetical protein